MYYREYGFVRSFAVYKAYNKALSDITNKCHRILYTIYFSIVVREDKENNSY